MDHNQRNNPQVKKPPEMNTGKSPAGIQGGYELILNWYKTSGKNIMGEEVISGLHIDKLMDILGNPIWNHIYHCWVVELKHMPDLQPYVKHNFDPTKFVYFIEAYNNS